jgi:Na+/citrate or Na+/malate symporter
LNYALLDYLKLFRHESLVESSSDDNNNNQGKSTKIIPDVAAMVIEKASDSSSNNNVISTFTNQLIEAWLKYDGARQLQEENKKRQSEKKEAYKQLCDITNITSGSLAANKVFCIRKQEILNHTIVKARVK